MTDKMGAVNQTESTAAPATPFEPSPLDVLVVKTMLAKSGPLPFELVNRIIEWAEYWPCSHSFISYQSPGLMTSRGFGKDILVIRTPPIGFRRPVAHRNSRNGVIPPAPPIQECTPEYFEKYLGALTPTLLHPVRKVVFTIQSHDQGWGGKVADKNTFQGSWTWFEVGQERIDLGATCPDEEKGEKCKHRPLDKPDRLPPNCKLRQTVPVPISKDIGGVLEYKLLPDHAYMIQCNRTANGRPETHTITWSYTDDVHPDSAAAEALVEKGRGRETGMGAFVRSLMVGDEVSVWAKARFPGWTNHVLSIGIDVYWAL
ncbi:uncharacterized protein DNG_03045 [Cephalotrichum gorgonifer]|uniref:Uncharacterized protein n=1 Tax=Cephalotrichum gorgonifer TaxID=2041049 RepID=A0AAE8ST71_9PEZI|nr:uncharacterized protein DNG_03045 [Cephalotrichum gorgonifer]